MRGRGVQGGCATQRLNHQKCRHCASSTRCPGIIPQEELAAEADVLPLWTCCSSSRFLRGGAQTTRTGAAAPCGQDNPTHETGPYDPVRSIYCEKEAAKTGARGGPEEHAHVEYFGGNARGAAGGKGYLLPFLRRSPETEDVHKGPRDDVRHESRGVATTVSRTTFASRPTKVPAPPWGGCVTRGTTTPDCSKRTRHLG